MNGLDVSSSGHLSNGDVYNTNTTSGRCIIADNTTSQKYYYNSTFIGSTYRDGYGHYMYVDDDISVSSTLLSSDKETRPINLTFIIWLRTA